MNGTPDNDSTMWLNLIKAICEDIKTQPLEAEKQIELLQEQLSEARQELETLRFTHADTLASAKFKIGSAVYEAIKNPLKLFILPFKCVKIFFEKKEYDKGAKK